MPQRLRLSRAKGFRLPEGAISVARPSRWGNPFTVAKAEETGYRFNSDSNARSFVVHCFEDWIAKGRRSPWWFEDGKDRYEYMSAHIRDLRSHDLACWCPLDGLPCHAQTLIDLANR
jgi:hypothetical protein